MSEFGLVVGEFLGGWHKAVIENQMDVGFGKTWRSGLLNN